MYICWFLKFLVVFFVESLQNLAAMPELFNWSTSKAWQVLSTKHQNCNKQLPVAIIVPADMNTVIGILVYGDIPSDLRSRPEQSHHLPGALLPR